MCNNGPVLECGGRVAAALSSHVAFSFEKSNLKENMCPDQLVWKLLVTVKIPRGSNFQRWGKSVTVVFASKGCCYLGVPQDELILEFHIKYIRSTCHCLISLIDSFTHYPIFACAKSLQLCLTLSNPVDYIASQALLSLGFSRQEYWSGLPFPPPGDLSRD